MTPTKRNIAYGQQEGLHCLLNLISLKTETYFGIMDSFEEEIDLWIICNIYSNLPENYSDILIVLIEKKN